MILITFNDYSVDMSNLSLHKISGSSPEETLQLRQEAVKQNWSGGQFDAIFPHRLNLHQVMNKNCENMIGTVEVPLGLAGPLEIHIQAKPEQTISQEVWIPLATTEGALIASVSRGMKLLQKSGGVNVFVEKKGMSRAPVFQCKNGAEAVQFANWLKTQTPLFEQQATQFSSHLTFLNLYTWVEGRHVYARFHFDTDEAMGMNMITIFLEQMSTEILKAYQNIKLIALSSNVCGDKKPSLINKILGRGWWTQAEVFISTEQLKNTLHCEPKPLIQTHIQKNLVGSHLAGSLGQNAHISNIVAAFYLATGQDIAQTVNASLGTTTIEETHDGIYAAVTIPEIDIGSVGGGTTLLPQSQARSLICQNSEVEINSQLLAATVTAGCLAGELSLLGALTTKQLGSAHRKLGWGEQ